VLQASKVNRGANLIIEVEAVTYDASINDLTAISPTVGSYNPPITLPYAGQPTPLVLDTALLSDSDAEMGVYATAIPDPNGTGWSGGFLYGSPLGGSFSALEAIGAVAAQGQLLTELPVTGFFVVDRTTKVRVLMNQQILQSIPDYDFYAFKQIAYINGELISFQNANLVAPNAYELSNLIRGIRGTENLIATHATGSDFYLLKGNFGFIDIDGELAQLKNTYEFKAVPPGVSQTAINNIQTLTITGNRLKPYAPVNPRITRRPGNSLLVEWFRRSRKNGIWLDGVEDVPLNEANQAYDVEIFNGTTLMRTVTRSFPSYTYPNQHQIQDFGSLQNELTFKVYQKSIYIGRGYPLIANGLGISKFM
jgi:hypothetical protein